MNFKTALGALLLLNLLWYWHVMRHDRMLSARLELVLRYAAVLQMIEERR